jgi:hypothetical protein
MLGPYLIEVKVLLHAALGVLLKMFSQDDVALPIITLSLDTLGLGWRRLRQSPVPA